MKHSLWQETKGKFRIIIDPWVSIILMGSGGSVLSERRTETTSSTVSQVMRESEQGELPSFPFQTKQLWFHQFYSLWEGGEPSRVFNKAWAWLTIWVWSSDVSDEQTWAQNGYGICWGCRSSRARRESSAHQSARPLPGSQGERKALMHWSVRKAPQRPEIWAVCSVWKTRRQDPFGLLMHYERSHIRKK